MTLVRICSTDDCAVSKVPAVVDGNMVGQIGWDVEISNLLRVRWVRTVWRVGGELSAQLPGPDM